MQDLQLQIEESPLRSDIEVLSQGLREHALPITGVAGFIPIAVFARDHQGHVLAGIQALHNWNWLHICLAWIHPERRHQGLGSRLLRAIEQAGIERGCRHAHLDTFSYQARPFYEKHGYTVFGQLDDYPPGHARYFMRKPLAGD